MAQTTYHAASNDSLLDQCWWLKSMNVFHAWKYTTGSPSVKFGLSDSGICSHTDLPLPQGMSVFPGDQDYANRIASNSHGSMCWANVMAIQGNAEGLSGVAPGLTGYFASAGLDIPDITTALAWAISNGIRVLNVSWGPYAQAIGTGPLWNGAEYIKISSPSAYTGMTEFQTAMASFKAAGGIFITAAGDGQYNQPDDVWSLPAYGDPSITLNVSGYQQSLDNNYVGGTGPRTSGSSGVDYGTDVNICAPAFGNLQPNSARNNSLVSGYWSNDWLASGAAPLVAGVCGLVLSVNPVLTNTQVIAILRSTAERSVRGGVFNARFPNAGRVNAGKAVKKALSTVAANAGVVYPYLGMSGAGATVTVNPATSSATTTLNGDVWLDITGFSSDPITVVELWVGTKRIYHGPPAVLHAQNAVYTAGGGNAALLTVVARTANGSASDTYTDILVDSSLEVLEPYYYPGTAALQDNAWQHKRMNVYHAWKYGHGGSTAKVLEYDASLSYDGYRTQGSYPNQSVIVPYQFLRHPGLPTPDVLWDVAVNAATSIDNLNDPNTYSHGTDVMAHLKGGGDCLGVAPSAWMAYFTDANGAYASQLVTKALSLGVKIINLSGEFWIGTHRQAIADFMAAGGLVFVAMDYGPQGHWWAEDRSYYRNNLNQTTVTTDQLEALPGTICVSGVAGVQSSVYDDPKKFLSDACAWGPGVDIVAPSADSYSASCYVSTWADYGWTGPEPWPFYGYWGGCPTPDPATRHPSTSFGTPMVAAVAHLIWEANPSLTAAQVKAILLGTADVGRHADFATRYPNAGIVCAGKAVKKALATRAENAGQIFPYLGISGAGTYPIITGGAATLALSGSVWIDLDAFSSDTITSVELWSGTTRIYSGPAARFQATATAGSGSLLKVKAFTATGATTEVYSDILTAGLGSFDTTPPTTQASLPPGLYPPGTGLILGEA